MIDYTKQPSDTGNPSHIWTSEKIAEETTFMYAQYRFLRNHGYIKQLFAIVLVKYF